MVPQTLSRHVRDNAIFQTVTHHNDLLVFTQSFIIVTCYSEMSNPHVLRSSSSQKGSYQKQDSSYREDGQSILSSQVCIFFAVFI